MKELSGVMDVRIKAVAAAGVFLNFLDSLTTYYVLAAGIGEEANPLLAPLYQQNLLLTFLVFIITSAAVVKSVYAYVALTDMMNGRLRELSHRMFVLLMSVVVAAKALVVANNVCVITVRQSPIVDFLSWVAQGTIR